MNRVRYLNDPVFHNVVTALMKVMEDFKLQPSDIREAVDTAIDLEVEDLRRRLHEYEA